MNAESVRSGSIACQTASRVDRQPVGRPNASSGEFANEAASMGPRSCARFQRVSISHFASDVEVHLYRRGVPHHRATLGPARVEVALHRAVARGVDDARTRTGRIEADRGELDTARFERVPNHGQVGRHGVARDRDAGVRWAAELELTPRFEGDLAAAGKCVGQEAADQVGRRRHGSAARPDHPLELDADLGIPAGCEHPLIDEALDGIGGERAGARRHGLAVTEVGGDPREVADRRTPEVACSHRILLTRAVVVRTVSSRVATFVSSPGMPPDDTSETCFQPTGGDAGFLACRGWRWPCGTLRRIALARPFGVGSGAAGPRCRGP